MIKLLNNNGIDDLFSDLDKDPEFQEAMEELEPGYQITRLRLKKDLTQAQLAELAGTSQSSIARLENGSSPPSLSFLRRVAKALDATVKVEIRSNLSDEPQVEDQSALLDAVNYLHEDAVEDIQNEKYFDSYRKLYTLNNLIQKYPPTQEMTLISNIIIREIKFLDQFTEINIDSAKVDSTI